MQDRAAAAARTGKAEAKWRSLDAEQRTSGLSVRAFCVARGVSAASLFAWRRRLRPAPAAAPVSFVEVVSPASTAGLPAARLNEASPLELELRDGRRVLLLRRGFDASLLRDVLTALEGVA